MLSIDILLDNNINSIPDTTRFEIVDLTLKKVIPKDKNLHFSYSFYVRYKYGNPDGSSVLIKMSTTGQKHLLVGCPINHGDFLGTSLTLREYKKSYNVKVGDPSNNILEILPPIISRSYCKLEKNILENIVGGDILINSSGSQVETSST